MKKLLIIMMALALITGVGVIKAEAATSDSITITVTLQSVSVSVSPGSWVIGNVVASSTNTQACTASNDGNVNEDLNIAVINSASWSAGALTAAETFVLDFSLSGTAPWTNITNAGVSLITGLAPGDQAFTLQFTAPSSSVDAAEQTITLTVSASAS